MEQRKTRATWADLVQEYQRSGESHAAFCDRKGLVLGTFRTWLYKLRRADAAEPITVLPVHVRATPEAHLAAPNRLVVETGAVRVHVEVGTDPVYVAALVAELGRC